MNHLVIKHRPLLRIKIAVGPSVWRQTHRTFFLTSYAKSEFRHSEDLTQERYELRANEATEKKRARLLYQSRKRGMLENGVILASFANKFLSELDAEQLDQYDRLINLPTNDWDIYYWATKTKPTPVEFETPVMQKLREHLNSKVSKKANNENNKTKNKISILDTMKPNDIIMPAKRKLFNLDIDVSQVNLTNYEQEFDNRVKKFGSGLSIVRMTDWRKKYIVRRLRRTISSPVSLRNLSDDKQTEVFTQKVNDKSIATGNILQTDLIDSTYERNMKHHNFIQRLMSYNFTDNVHDYDDEAEAWANILWHRNYGSADVTIAPQSIKCTGCNAKLHCCDPGLYGYIPKELFAALEKIQQHNELKCQRCKFSQTYNASLSADVPNETYLEVLRKLKQTKSSIICLLVDITDFPSGIWDNLIDIVGHHHNIIVVGNKLDLLPNDGLHLIERVINSLKRNLTKLWPGYKNLHIQDVVVLSARTGFGVESLITRLLALSEIPKDIYLLGCSNSGKSTLFNALLQSDLSAIRKGDLMSRISVSRFLETELNMLKFPISLPEGWEVELKKRRMKKVERDTKLRERSLASTTMHRQATIPHMSMLINRIEFLPQTNSSTKSNVIENSHERPRFTEDHPLAYVKNSEHLSATQEKFNEHAFFYHTPSTSHRDQLHDLLTNEERLEVFPHETITPRKYSLRPLQSILISGLARLELLTSNSNVIVTIFASRYLPVHVIPTRKADKFYYTFLGSPYLGVPFGDEERLKVWPKLVNSKPDFLIKGVGWNRGVADIVMSSVGWALINVCQDQECIVRAFTPEGRGIFLREPPLLPYANKLKGKKIRDTPLFTHPHYTIERSVA